MIRMPPARLRSLACQAGLVVAALHAVPRALLLNAQPDWPHGETRMPYRRHAARRRQWFPLGLCGSVHALQARAASVAASLGLPLDELYAMHRVFGGDASVHANQPMPQKVRSGGTISALSVQIPALEKLEPYLRRDGAQVLDLGFGSGIMVGMMLALAGEGAHVVGVDLADKVPVATANLLSDASACSFLPFSEESFTLVGGDVFDSIEAWEKEGKLFDVMYSGCSMDHQSDQLRRFLGRLKNNGAAVFNLGTPGQQGMYFVADRGRVCELLMRVNFMMCESPRTPRRRGADVPLEPDALGAWVRANVFADTSSDL